MLVRYVFSACVVIQTPDLQVCCDPWFTPGAYDGSWYQYPALTTDPLAVIGPVDAIYVSHIHPDHYDPTFLRRYLRAFPSTRLLVGETEPNYLAQKMRVDGFKPEIVHTLEVGATTLSIIPNRAFEADNVDTALVVRHRELSVVNMNDNPVDAQQLDAIRALLPGGRATVALLPYTGAGPYPQTYVFESAEAQRAAADRKKTQFQNLYASYLAELKPARAIPFAGQYHLGGPLSRLNDLRGLSDAVDMKALHPDVTVVLADGGAAVLDVATLRPSAVRDDKYDSTDIESHLQAIDFRGYDYEREITPLDGHALPLIPLLQSAVARARQGAAMTESFWFCIRPEGWERWAVFDVASAAGVTIQSTVDELTPRAEIHIDPRYLFGLLTRLYHWNNAEVGSQYMCRRVPDVYRREVYAFLHRFHV